MYTLKKFTLFPENLIQNIQKQSISCKKLLNYKGLKYNVKSIRQKKASQLKKKEKKKTGELNTFIRK